MLWMDPSVAQGRAPLPRRHPGDGDTTGQRKPNREKSCTKCAPARWRAWARFRSPVTTAPWTARRCSSCSPGLYFERTGDLATVSELWPHIEAALHWIDAYGDRDGDGFVEYQRRRDRAGQPGLEGLGRFGVPRRRQQRGRPDRALRSAGLRLRREAPGGEDRRRRRPGRARATNFGREAEDLRIRFEEAFWSQEIGTYALALDGRKRPCRVRSSNAGQLLFTGIVAEDRAAAVAEQLMGADLLHRLGDQDDRLVRGALQPDVLPQRLGLAARQRADRPGLRPLWPATRTPGGS